MKNTSLNFFGPPLVALITDPTRDRFEAHAYLCPANKLTIGYGHVLLPRDAPIFATLSAQTLGRMITECQAARYVTQHAKNALWISTDTGMKLLKTDVLLTVEYLHTAIHVELNQNQFDALVSFVFNVGQANFSTSTLKKKINAGDFSGAAAEFDRWTKAHVWDKRQGKSALKPLPGLVARRAAERKLFESL